MKRIISLSFLFFIAIMVSGQGFSQEAKTVKLPDPDTKGGRPLMQALSERKSSRNLSDKDIPDQVLSDLLWAAFGVNRKGGGGRTAPSAQNMQEIDIYVAKKDGLYRYMAEQNSLELVLAQDIRSETGLQGFVKDAPVNLVYVADYSKMGKVADKKDFYAGADCGFISQNVYLFCASEGLGTVVRGWFDEGKLKKRMNLGQTQRIVFTQTVGYPKE